MPTVALVKSSQSYKAVIEALEMVRRDVHLPEGKPILVKPNLVNAIKPLSGTPVDAVRATLDFLLSLGAKKFIIGEITAGPQGDTTAAFSHHGYLPLANQYDVEFRNLNEDETVLFQAFDETLNPIWVRIARTYLESFVVSVARMKTHNRVVATLSIKNIAIGAIVNEDRYALNWHTFQPGKFSHEARPINLSLARLYQTIPLGLAIVDGVIGMEGDGPGGGTPISSGVALASADALALDITGAEIMGFDYRTMGYLWYLSQLRGLKRQDIKIVGENPANCISRYLPHKDMVSHLGWWVNDWKDHLQGGYLQPTPG
jgi:uncharacterized protein (DUF362 family)